MNQDVSLKPVDQPLRTMRSDRERKLSVVKVMLQNQYRNLSSEILARSQLIYALNNHLSRKLRVPIHERDVPQHSNLQMRKCLLLKEVSAYTKQEAEEY